MFSHIVDLRCGEAEVDDIDHLGNLVFVPLQIGSFRIPQRLWKMKRSIQERMNLKQLRADNNGSDELIICTLINSQPLMSSLDYFFARGELSQVVDQTNPCHSWLTSDVCRPLALEV